MTYMSLYAARMFGAQDVTAGFAASSFVLGAILARIFIGKYVDFIGRRRTLILALLLYAVCSVLYLVALNYPALIAVRMLHGASFGVFTTALATSVIGLIPPTRRSEGLGYYLLAGTLANALGPLAAVQFTVHLEPSVIFIFTGVISVASLLGITAIRVPEREVTDDERENIWKFRFSDVIDGRALPVALVVLTLSGGYSVLITYLNPYLIGEDMPTAASLFFVTFAAAMLVVRLFVGRLQDRRGDNAVVPALLVIFATGLVLLTLAESLVLILLAAALGGFGYGGALPSLQVTAVNRADPHRVAVATVTHYLMLDMGLLLGPVLYGAFIPVVGYQWLFLLAAAGIVIGVVIYWRTHGRHRLQGR